jgi:hypothetical protein
MAGGEEKDRLPIQDNFRQIAPIRVTMKIGSTIASADRSNRPRSLHACIGRSRAQAAEAPLQRKTPAVGKTGRGFEQGVGTQRKNPSDVKLAKKCCFRVNSASKTSVRKF